MPHTFIHIHLSTNTYLNTLSVMQHTSNMHFSVKRANTHFGVHFSVHTSVGYGACVLGTVRVCVGYGMCVLGTVRVCSACRVGMAGWCACVGMAGWCVCLCMAGWCVCLCMAGWCALVAASTGQDQVECAGPNPRG